jgi:Flp pilus assembly protein CpaB
LVTIGIVLFIAGGAIAFISVENGNKTKTPSTVSAVNVPVVVATSAIPAGTTGQEMQSQGWVTIESIPQRNYNANDLTSLTSLDNVVVTTSVPKGQAIQSTQLTASTSAISLPQGMDAVTVTLVGVNGLAGYLQPGSRVDVYANVTKSSVTQSGAWVPTGITLPCTELTMVNVEVLDVSSTSPALSGSRSTAGAVVGSNGGRSIPGSETLLLAVTPDESQTINYFTQNATLSVVQTQKDTLPPTIAVCKGTGQYSVVP